MKFTAQHLEILSSMAGILTSDRSRGEINLTICESIIGQRMSVLGIDAFDAYMSYAQIHEDEFEWVIHALTIHTTSFFRNPSEWEGIKARIEEQYRDGKTNFKVMVAACSSGEEVVTLALIFERLKRQFPRIKYTITAFDVDPISVKYARKMIYPDTSLNDIPIEYREAILKGSGQRAGHFTLEKEVREKCNFLVANLKNTNSLGTDFDIITCMHVLIYFEERMVYDIVNRLGGMLSADGFLAVGATDALDAAILPSVGLQKVGPAVYTRRSSQLQKPKPKPRVRIDAAPARASKLPTALVVDDDAIPCHFVRQKLQKAGFVVHLAHDTKQADEILSAHSIDVISLDLIMPGENGDVWLQRKRKQGMRIPTIIVTGLTNDKAKKVVSALSGPSVDFYEKKDLYKNSDEFVGRIKSVLGPALNVEAVKEGIPTVVDRPDVVLIGSSTGGPLVLKTILRDLPETSPPIVVVQHIHKDFANQLARSLALTSGLKIGDGGAGDILHEGTIYFPFAEKHIAFFKSPDGLRLGHDDGPKVEGCKPSVDVLFKSVPKKGVKVLGMILTGMGKDGVAGLKYLRECGHLTVAQDQSSATVWGMPGKAVEEGAVESIASPEELRNLLITSFGVQKKSA